MSNFVKITTDILDIGSVSNKVADPATGATSIFIGTTRNEFQGKKVIRLDYEAYVPMAEKKLHKLCEEIRSKWPAKVHNIAIYHRLGTVEPTEASVVIAITSAHRKESLEAVQYAIERLKATIPIWKKEIYKDNDVPGEWKENKECSWSMAGKESIQQQKHNTEEKLAEVNDMHVQITAPSEEIERRIESFMQRKREEVNANNVLEFCSRHLVNDEPDEYSCARVDATGLIRKKDSSSHLRKSQVDNSNCDSVPFKGAFKSSDKNKSDKIIQPPALTERMVNLEEHLSLKPVPKELYTRLKDIEARVLYLEGMSPEYFGNVHTSNQSSDSNKVFTDESLANGAHDDKRQDKFRLNPTESPYHFGVNERTNCDFGEVGEYREALSESLCVINRRIQELQSKLQNSKHS